MPSNFIRFISGQLKTASICVFVVLSGAANLSAQTSTWTNANSFGSPNPFYDFSDNWDPVGAPGSTEGALFNLDATYEVWWDDISVASFPSVRRIDVAAGDVTFLNREEDEQLEFSINSGLFVDGPGTSLSINGLHLNQLGRRLNINNGGSVIVGGSHPQGSQLSISEAIDIGEYNGENNSSLVTLPNGRINIGEIGASAPNVNISIGGLGYINIREGGSITTDSLAVGTFSGEGSLLTILGAGSNPNSVKEDGFLVSDSLIVGEAGTGSLSMRVGAKAMVREATVGQKLGSYGFANVTNANTLFQATDTLKLGGSSLSTHGRGEVEVSDSAQIVVGNDFVTSPGVEAALRVGSNSSGILATLNIGEGSLLRVSDGDSFVGSAEGYSGLAIVAGTDARWENEGLLSVGLNGAGVLSVLDGGTVATDDAIFGFSSTSFADVTVSGLDSKLEVGDQTTVGSSFGGEATIRVSNGGVISTSELSMRNRGTLNINAGGLVRVSEETEFLGSDSSVNLQGGRFEFGRTSMEDFERINTSAVSGAMAGVIRITGTNNIADFNALKSSNADISEVNLVNNGTLVGDAALESGLVNESGAAIQITDGQTMRFGGAENSSAGSINLSGGRIEFASNLIHQSSGFISGHGVFMASEWTNDGVLQFTDGDSEIHGAITQGDTGVIVVDGFGDATFHDDVIITSNDNQNIFVANGSTAFVMGSFNGGNGGEGDVQVMGSLTPGNSPASVSFGGDLSLADGSELQIELGGLAEDRFDQVFVLGDLFLDGALDVALIDGFTLDEQQEFLIVDVAGNRTGLFDGLANGGLVGNFDGVDLFINYGAGDGNDIGLTTTFSAIPEPSSACILAMIMGGLLFRRNRNVGE